MTLSGSLRSFVKGLRRLTWRDVWQLPLFTVEALAMELAVRVVRLPKLASALGVTLIDDGSSVPARGDPQRHALAQRKAAPIDRFYGKWPISGSCLRRSLILGFHVRRLDPVLHIGVARTDGEVRAHAWIEVDGKPVGREDGDYAPLRRTETAS